jgi:hypothetical protein
MIKPLVAARIKIGGENEITTLRFVPFLGRTRIVRPPHPLGPLFKIRHPLQGRRILINGGENEIRTHERVTPLPVFKTGAFGHSAISPRYVRLLRMLDRIKPCVLLQDGRYFNAAVLLLIIFEYCHQCAANGQA